VNRTTCDEDIVKLINNRQNGRRRGRGGGAGAPRPNGANGGADRGNRIDNRARGNAAQLHEKYKTLARDAQMQGDRVNTEYYLQFADHYFRVLGETRARFEEQQPRQRRDEYQGQSDHGISDQGEGFDEDYGDEGERADVGSDQVADGNRAPREDGQNDRGNRYRGDQNQREQGTGNRDQQRGNRREQTWQPREENVPQVEVRPEVQPEGGYEEQTEVEAPRPRRGRRPARAADEGEVSERIEMDRLPPSFAVTTSAEPANDSGEDGDDKPRRPRRRVVRGDSAPADV
jgi:hypothetical protein